MSSRHRRAVKVWDRRDFRDLDDTVEQGTRNLKLALRRLRRFARQGAATELDLPDTIRSTAKNAGTLDLKLVPERHNAVKVLLFLDVGGSMDDFVKLSEELFSAARSEFKHLEYFYFHNFPYERVWKNNRRRHDERLSTFEVIRKYGPDYKLIFVGDAAMSPYEITMPGGSVEHMNDEPGRVWLERLTSHYTRAAWLESDATEFVAACAIDWHDQRADGRADVSADSKRYRRDGTGVEPLSAVIARSEATKQVSAWRLLRRFAPRNDTEGGHAMARLAGKVALITGAGTGIGRATGVLFAREGARVAIAEIDAVAGEETAHLAGNGAIAIRTDVTDEASMQAAVRATAQQFGALHILHNNAGGSTPQDNTVVEAPIEEFWRVIQLDLFGTFLGCRVGIPEIIRSGGGSVINMSSNVALMGIRRARLLYCGKGRCRSDHSLDGRGVRTAARTGERHRAIGHDDRARAQAGGGQCGTHQAGGSASARTDRTAGHRRHGAFPRIRRIPHGHRSDLSGGQRSDDFLRSQQ